MTQSEGNSTEAQARDKFGVLRQPSVVGSASALIGLVVGVILGRTSAATTADETMHLTAFRKADTHAASEPEKDEAAKTHRSSSEFRLGLGLRSLARDEGSGFGVADVNHRPVARLVGEEATVYFAVEAKTADYVFTTVVHLEGAGKATLHSQVDGHALSDAHLEPGWGMYSSPIPRAQLSGESHVLSLSVDPAGAGSAISLDSVAIMPVGTAVTMSMGEQAIGNVIEGFSKPGKASTWSEGPRSRLGVVLSPTAADYHLSVLGAAAPGTVPQRVSIQVNGTNVGATEIALAKGESNWVVPAMALQPGLNIIELSYSKTSRPSEIDPQSRDRREIAVRFSKLSLEPIK